MIGILVTEKNWVLGLDVVRGPDWEWQDQDGGAGNRGILRFPSKKHKGWVHVTWKWIQNTKSHMYRIGAEGKYDLIYTGQKMVEATHPVTCYIQSPVYKSIVFNFALRSTHIIISPFVFLAVILLTDLSSKG